MPRPKNYAFEKAQRERARQARKAARKSAKAASKTEEEPSGEAAVSPSAAAESGDVPDKDPTLG